MLNGKLSFLLIAQLLYMLNRHVELDQKRTLKNIKLDLDLKTLQIKDS